MVGGSESLDQFGTSVASGDFDADGFADLAVGAIGEDRPSDGTKPFGSVTVLPGSEAGVSGAGSRRFRPADAGSDQVWGGGEATGDLDGDGYDDLVVSAGSQSFDEQVDGVSVLYGSATGLYRRPRGDPRQHLGLRAAGSRRRAGTGDGRLG